MFWIYFDSSAVMAYQSFECEGREKEREIKSKDDAKGFGLSCWKAGNGRDAGGIGVEIGNSILHMFSLG